MFEQDALGVGDRALRARVSFTPTRPEVH